MDNNSSNDKRTTMQKLQKYEPLIAGIALAIGLALFAGFIITFVIKTNKEAEQLVARTSSAYYENPYYDEFTDENDLSLELLVSPDGEEIVSEYVIYEGVYLTADSSGMTVLVDENKKKVNETIFVSDEGHRITASSSDKGVTFKSQDAEIKEFTLDGHVFAVGEDKKVTVDGYKMINDPAAVPVTTTVPGSEEDPEETTVPGSVTEEVTTTTPETVTTPEVTTTPESKTEAVTTTPKPKTTPKATTTTTKKKTTTTTTTTKKKTTTTTTTTKKKTTTATSYHTDDKFVAKVLELVNKERAKEGIAPLKGSIALDQAAQIRAKEIVSSDGEKYFLHKRRNGDEWYTVFSERGIRYKLAGENIAQGCNTPEELVQAWMESPDHRANILDPDFTHMGLGYYDDGTAGDPWYFAAQLFATF